MAQFNTVVPTNLGIALINKALAGECTITLTKAQAGDGTWTTDLADATALQSMKQEVGISEVKVINNQTVSVLALFSNLNLQTGYYVKEFGIFAAEEGNEATTEVLYAIVTAVEGKEDFMPPYNSIAPQSMEIETYVTVANASSVTVQAGTGAFASADSLGQVDQLQTIVKTSAVAAINEVVRSVGALGNLATEDKTAIVNAVNEVINNIGALNTLASDARTSIVNSINSLVSLVTDSMNRTFYVGRDLTVVFADEIANYSDEWAWIQARLNNHNVSDLRVGDYIPITIAASGSVPAETHKAEIAGINTYRKTGDTEIGYHIDWITRDCYSQTVQWNTSNVNNGNSTKKSPFLASNLKSWLDNTLYPLLPAKLRNVIKAKRILAPYRFTSGSTLTDDNSWGWEDFDKLWVPLEAEIFDQTVWSTRGYGNGQAVQYPLLANSYSHRIKGSGPDGSRCTWWTASAHGGSSTGAVNVYGSGHSDGDVASTAHRVPVCFRTMEDAA